MYKEWKMTESVIELQVKESEEQAEQQRENQEHEVSLTPKKCPKRWVANKGNH